MTINTTFTNTLLFFISVLLFLGCSEGDIITVSVDVVGALENCSNENNNSFVFYVVHEEDNKSSLSVSFTSTTFDIAPDTTDTISLVEPTEISLNTTTNQLLYRTFNSAINGLDYFCASIPPSNTDLNQELASSNGTIEISYAILDDTDPNQTIYSRLITLRNITLIGNDVEIRQEVLVLGTDQVTIPN